jgi:ATP-binding cassette subfamily C protein LapB
MLTTVSLTTVGAVAIINQQLTIGALIATNMLSGRLLGPFNQLVGTWRAYAGLRQAIERLGHVFNMASERRTCEVELERPLGEITLEDVTFSYSEGAKPVVDTVSVAFPAGGVHALIGRNGSGKSTLLKLAQGLYRPSKGRVLLDGADVAQFTRSELARWIGYVPQECVLFAGTLRDNIGHRKPEATDEEIIKAATAAGVHEFIIDLSDGYASEIGEAGQRLSAGQRQRIAIARALVGDPPVLLLDEPSSSLDRQAEQDLRNTLAAIGKDRTVVVITHSAILLSVCKDLVALDRGRIALAGPADEILPRLWGGTRVAPHGGQPAERPAIINASLETTAALRRGGSG